MMETNPIANFMRRATPDPRYLPQSSARLCCLGIPSCLATLLRMLNVVHISPQPFISKPQWSLNSSKTRPSSTFLRKHKLSCFTTHLPSLPKPPTRMLVVLLWTLLPLTVSSSVPQMPQTCMLVESKHVGMTHLLATGYVSQHYWRGNNLSIRLNEYWHFQRRFVMFTSITGPQRSYHSSLWSLWRRSRWDLALQSLSMRMRICPRTLFTKTLILPSCIRELRRLDIGCLYKFHCLSLYATMEEPAFLHFSLHFQSLTPNEGFKNWEITSLHSALYFRFIIRYERISAPSVCVFLCRWADHTHVAFQRPIHRILVLNFSTL